jgi:hypothetical protein
MIQSYYAPRFNVVVQGITMAANITQQVISVTYSGSLDHADMFKIVFSNTNGQYTDLSLFSPGVEVELYMGYGDNLTPMMLGVITTIEPNFPESGPPTIAISGYDKSYNMRHGESIPRQFEFMTDSLMVAEVALENLLIPICDPSPWYHESLTQTGTDWAFIKGLAMNNLFDAYVYWNNLYFQFPIQLDAYVLEWGQSLRSFSPRLATATMAGLQIIRGYNETLAQAMIGVATGSISAILSTGLAPRRSTCSRRSGGAGFTTRRSPRRSMRSRLEKRCCSSCSRASTRAPAVVSAFRPCAREATSKSPASVHVLAASIGCVK